jgi:proline iminopeptidase
VPERYVGGLFVDLRGKPSSPPVLYLHGGPGMSCFHFMIWQGERLARTCHVVGLDQRGVLRSAPLSDGARITEQVLVDDCETVRAALGIPQWTVIGHSFGGRVALRYACQHPHRVRAVIFENPCWDWDDTERLRLPAAAAIFDELGEHDQADRCRRLATGPERITDWRETVELVGGLNDHGRYDDLYFHQPAARNAWQDLDLSEFPEELRSRAQVHAEQALDLCMEPVLDLLSGLTVPATLIVGRYDLVTGPVQREAFRKSVRHGQIREFTESGHFVQLEQPDEYAGLIGQLSG